tara:strand:- start:461 stop:2341 length:1881 start_codon:yes stop_codon:yes gene_type:complete
MKNLFDFKYLKSDAFGGITAGIVALPLALAFGEQSGLGAAAGLYGAAFIAFFASLFGGTPTQISGPTAPMTALSMLVIGGLVQAYEGSVEKALPVILMVFILAGLFQILLGIIRAGTYIKYIPYTVVSGFMTGIGVIIILTQLPLAFGYSASDDMKIVEKFKPHAEELILDRILKDEAEDGILVLEEFKETISRAELVTVDEIDEEARILAKNDSKSVLGSVKYLPRALQNIDWMELMLCLITIAIVFGFKKITKAVPSTLVALLVVSVGAYFFVENYNPISAIPQGIPIPHFEVITQFSISELLPFVLSALFLALLGSIDSLLTSVVADNMTKTQHKPNKELVGQGIGNMVAGLFGGLPGAGATIRTVVNIQAGGRTRLSGMITGLLLVVIVIALAPLASMIPAAVLVGILITVGIGVIDYKGLRALRRMDISEAFILLLVLFVTVFYDLIAAVGVGLVIASVVFMKRMSDLSEEEVEVYDLSHSEEKEAVWEDESSIPDSIREKVVFKHLSGPMFFGFATHFKNLLSDLGDLHVVVIRLEKVPFIDQSGVYSLEASLEDLRNQGVIVVITGPNEQVCGKMRDMNIIPQLVSENHVFKDFNSCKLWLKEVLTEQGRLDAELALLN